MKRDELSTFVIGGRVTKIKTAVSWRATWQAAMAFLKDPNVPNDSFADTDLQSLMVAAQTRRDQIRPPDSNTGDQP